MTWTFSRLIVSFLFLIPWTLFGFLYHDDDREPPSPSIQVQTPILPQTKESHPFDLTVVGKHSIYGSIAKQSVELIQALKNDLSISFIPMSFLTGLHLVSRDVQRILSTPGYRYKGKVLIVEDRMVEIMQGGLFERFGLPKTDEKQLRFVYDMCETSRISQKWVEMLNMYDAVLVPDEFLVEAYTESGVTVPIFVLPLGIYMDDFYAVKTHPRTNPHPFVFGQFSHICDRKDQVLLVQAFARAFGNNPNVRLWISGRVADSSYSKKIQEEIQKLGLVNVVYECGCDTRASYLQKYGKIDCYVNISQGEGFSYQPREAMFFCVPVIVSDNTAQHTICRSGLVRSVPAKNHNPCTSPELGHMLRCSIEDVAQAMLDVYFAYSKNIKYTTGSQAPFWQLTTSTNNPLFREGIYKDPLKARLIEARHWAQQYDYKNLRPLYLSILSPKRVVLGDKNLITPEEVQTTSKVLYTKIRSVFPNIAK